MKPCPEQIAELVKRAQTCDCCKKITEKSFGLELKYLRGIVNAKACFECADEYFEQLKTKYVVENYNGNHIYCVDGRYFPSWDSFYNLESLPICKSVIDLSNANAKINDSNL